MAKAKGPAAPQAANPEGAAQAAPGSGFSYKCTAVVALGPGVGDIQLSEAQRTRLSERRCVTAGVVDGWDALTQSVDFKAGETIVLRAEAPKALWPKLAKA